MFGKTVLDIDHIAVEKGSTYGLVGESGAGKTVLALTILRLLQTPPGEVAAGRILLDGEDLLTKSIREMERSVRGSRIAMIFQDPMSSLNPVFTVGQQLREVIHRRRPVLKKAAIEARAVELLETVKIADARPTLAKYPHELSGGQRQRVIIALALACGAELLIADEPTRNLDVTIQASILQLLKELQDEFQLTVLFIANNLSLVTALCDHIGVLSEGRILEQGPTLDVLRHAQEPYTKLLIETMRAQGETHRAETPEEADTILQVEDLKKHFTIKKEFGGGQGAVLKAVDGVSFALPRGHVLGIVGESGCGKSTLVNTVLKLFEPTAGRVLFNGQDIFAAGPKETRALHQQIQIVFQDPYWSLNPRWLVRDIVAEPIDVHDHLSGADRLAKVEDLLETVGLKREDALRYPHEFSGGERQRIAIARALSCEPSLVVLDEPTSSIDVFSQAQILELISELRARLGLTNILISHDLGVVSRLADHIMVMYLGKVVEYGPTDEVFARPRHPYTRALFDSIPRLESDGVTQLKTLEGSIPSPINPPSGCHFHTRCAFARPECAERFPDQTDVGGGHVVACLRVGEDLTDG
jgi:oligopeptide/dipeptide ABC transporter ATP-binding protein